MLHQPPDVHVLLALMEQLPPKVVHTFLHAILIRIGSFAHTQNQTFVYSMYLLHVFLNVFLRFVEMAFIGSSYQYFLTHVFASLENHKIAN